MNGVGWLQLTLQRAQLLFGENIFTFSSLFNLVAVLIFFHIKLTCSLFLLGGAPHHSVFDFWAVGFSRAQRPQGGPDLSPWQPVQSKPHGPGTWLNLQSWDLPCVMEPALCMSKAGGFICFWHRKPVNVVELPGSFEFTLIHFGCKPNAMLLLCSPRLWRSTVTSFQSSQRMLFFARGLFKSVFDSSVEMKKTCLIVILSVDFFVFLD